MKLSLEPVTPTGCELARQWRNQCLETLRTPFPLTEDQQIAFYESLQERVSPNRYWEVWTLPYTDRGITLSHGMVGFGGLTNIDYVNGCAEISLIVSPQHKRLGIGSEAIRLLCREALDNMRLNQVYGEVYFSNPGIDFWRKVVENYGGYSTTLPDRKWWNGSYWDSLYFSISRFP